MKRSLLSTTAAACLVLAVIGTSATHAGDREWSTAGKILSGAVAFSLLDNALGHRKRHVRHRERAYSGPNCPPRYRHPRPRRHHFRRDRRQYNHRYTKPHRPAKRIKGCDDDVIVHIENGRRIMQPRVKGATAYLQVYSEVCHEWVTIEEYPSIW